MADWSRLKPDDTSSHIAPRTLDSNILLSTNIVSQSTIRLKEHKETKKKGISDLLDG